MNRTELSESEEGADARLTRVVEGIVRIASGDLATPIPRSRARDQVDAVITGINLLAEELNSVYQDFEQRVDARTSELRAAHLEMERMALTDALTGSANRTALTRLLLQELESNAGRPAVLMLDMDAFKDINDSFGHLVGDKVLKRVAGRVISAVPEEAVVARLGGDEFAVLLPNTDTRSALSVAEDIQHSFNSVIRLEELDVWPRASIGVHMAQLGEQAEDIMLRADVAMYSAKEQGRGRIAVFEPVMLYARQLRRQTSAELRHAVTRGELFLEYQPVVSLTSGQVQGVEALVRWNHPTRGLLPPGEFIPVAEESGVIADVGAWVLQAALQQLGRWLEDGTVGPDFSLRVNLSAMELQRIDLVDTVRLALRGCGATPANLILEITESAFVAGGDVETYSLKALSALGVRIEIDDFGTGYSSISYLRRLPASTVKVDRALIKDIAEDEQQLEFVSAVHGLIRAAGMDAVFEGVETPEQARQLQRMQCCSGQGYYFSRPLSTEAATELLRSGARLPMAQSAAEHASAAG
ncbi:Cyclic di-GMP phosphodiesterase Gmr [Arthrobacter saudimassiliensis]|uniref:Cyclic di-GMP phosphodiesterase Gmr n=1 Tax=Arthrobacter saudimassiliensis TaxID=1461584 RepID=A0A078MMM0_9MICC|nr:Cyclic di-GMP phosphodiesterase Gmr [Arthrobacter saudimassiliensis]